jgi:signal transduction histidine kinase
MKKPRSLSFSPPVLAGAGWGLVAGAGAAWLLPAHAGWKTAIAAACVLLGFLLGYAREARRRLLQSALQVMRLRQELWLSQEHIISSGSCRSLGAFVDATMEEIRQPLRELASESRTLATDPSLTDGGRHAAERLAARAHDVGRVLGPLTSYSLTAPSKAPFNLNNLMRESIDLCRHRAQERGIRFEERFAVVPPVFGSAGRIQSALLNVIVNAVEAMPHAGGTITVETSHEGERVVARVKDAGIGIRPEHLGKVYDPFFTTKPDRGGSGLGLWETRQAVEMIGATIGITSVPLQGTEVTLTFPQSAPLSAGRAGVEHPPELKRNTA